MGITGSKKTPEDMLKENKRMIRKATRELEREARTLERQEKQLISQIKKAAKDGQMVRKYLNIFVTNQYLVYEHAINK